MDLLGRQVCLATPFWNQTQEEFDPLGNLLFATQNGSGMRYAYDAQNQLISENQTRYRYDALYNRLQKDEKTFDYNSLNQFADLPYDGNGNLISSYQYDALDRLVRFNDKTLIYDPFDRLIRIESDAKGTLDLIYLDKEEIGAMKDGVLSQLKIIDDEHSVYAIENEGQSYSVIQNHGNIVALYGNDQLHTRSYSAFSPTQTSRVPWGFAGKREIDELIYFGLQFYQPQLGRWLTPDPLYFEDGPNLYAYLKNNPFTHFDPYGLEGISWADSSMDFGKAFLSSYPKSTIDPIGACVNANCYPTGAAYWGEMAGRTAGILTNVLFWEYAAAKTGSECALGCGNYVVKIYSFYWINRALTNILKRSL